MTSLEPHDRPFVTNRYRTEDLPPQCDYRIPVTGCVGHHHRFRAWKAALRDDAHPTEAITL